MLGFGARRRRRGFCSGENRGQPSDRDQRPRERLAFWTGKRPMWAGRGTPRRADSAARPLAVGPRAQGKVANQDAGRFLLLGRLNSVSFYCFSIFSEAISIVFLNGFDYSLISIQFCTNVFIVLEIKVNSFASGNRNSYLFPLLSLYSYFYTLI